MSPHNLDTQTYTDTYQQQSTHSPPPNPSPHVSPSHTPMRPLLRLLHLRPLAACQQHEHVAMFARLRGGGEGRYRLVRLRFGFCCESTGRRRKGKGGGRRWRWSRSSGTFLTFWGRSGMLRLGRWGLGCRLCLCLTLWSGRGRWRGVQLEGRCGLHVGGEMVLPRSTDSWAEG
jgi:hypothetical protein